MSQIDLERLRVRQSFFVPTERKDLVNSIHYQLSTHLSPIYGHNAWFLREYGNTVIFEIDYGYMYVHLFASREPSVQEVENCFKQARARANARIIDSG